MNREHHTHDRRHLKWLPREPRPRERHRGSRHQELYDFWSRENFTDGRKEDLRCFGDKQWLELEPVFDRKRGRMIVRLLLALVHRSMFGALK